MLRVKEWSAFVYAFVAHELAKNVRNRDPDFVKILNAWRNETQYGGARPSARELAAYTVERAFQGAWAVWRVKRPSEDPDHFLRRYVYGNRGALADYRRIVGEPRPWPKFHRGHLLKSLFFGPAGKATEEYDYSKQTDEPVAVITLMTEADQSRFLRGTRVRKGLPPKG